MQDRDFDLKDLQHTQYYILCKLDEICKKIGANLVLACGTLLGAIRHDGFIPWDDDIDVLMSDVDFKKLKKYFKKHNNHIDGLFFADYSTDHETIHFLPRIRLDGTCVDEYATDELNINKGIWVDIFVFCDCAKNDKLVEIQKKLLGCIFMILEKYLNRYKRRHNIDFQNTRIYDISESLPEFLRIKLVSLLRAAICLLGSKNDKVFNLCMHTNYRVIPRRFIEELDEHVFETRKFKIPKDYDGYLRLYYGDNYMTPVVSHSHFPLDTVVFPEEVFEKIEEFTNKELA